MEKREVKETIELLVIGGSAGSFNVLLEVIPKIKTPINFAIIIILHRKSSLNSRIDKVFRHKTSLKVLECEDKDLIESGNIYFAPADYHLLLEKDSTVSLDYSEKVNYSRPSIDVTFKNTADLYGARMAGLLLSGANSDGAEGLMYIHQKSGTTIVQHPDSAEMNTMPKEALSLFKPDFVANVNEIIDLVNSF